MQAYHDKEWGRPHHGDRDLFELMTLEGAQAGLSWRTVLTRRQHYRDTFHQFQLERVAAMTDGELETILSTALIIRNRQKVYSVRSNAAAAQTVIKECGSLDTYLWSFVDGKPIVNHWQTIRDVPGTTPLSDRMSKDLRKRGFRFVGSTICYAFMQATGMVNDHLTDCFRYGQ